MSRTLDLRALKQEAQAAVTSPAEALDERTPVCPRTLNFSVTYDAPDGKTYTDDLQSVILDSDGRLAKVRVFHSLTAGMIADRLPQDEQLRLEALARMVTQLKDAPDWVLTWAGEDNELLSEINATLVRHETLYFRGNNRTGQEGERKPRVSVDCALFEETRLASPA